MMADILSFAAALVAALTFTPGARHLAFSVGLVDLPGPRKVHAAPMPLLGGLAVYVATLFSISVFVADEAWSQMLGIFVAATVALVVGVLDDRGFLHHQIKLMVAMPLAATILIGTGIHSEIFHAIERVPIVALPGPWLDYALSFVWIVGIMASFSILDHMDGLCAGVAAVASAFFFYFAWTSGQVLISSLAAAMLGATLGFLWWNFNPARIFLGDGGAMFIGLMMATLAIKVRFPEQPQATSWMVPVLTLGAAILDTTLVTLSRSRRGLVPFSSPGKDHIAHRLVSLGLTHRVAVLAVYGVAAVSGLVALGVTRVAVPAGLTLGMAAVGLALLAIVWLERTPYERQVRK